MNAHAPSTPSAPATLPSTLEELTQRKAALRQDIHAQKERMTRLGRDLVAPLAPAAEKSNSLLRAFNRGMAVFDGIMLGLNVMRKFKAIFGKKRKYRY